MSQTPTDGKKKRVRAPNFSLDETRLLIGLALKKKHVLENKTTDSDTWKLKEATWVEISKLFNANSGINTRSVETLRAKYDGLKKDLKKKVNKNKAETCKTGGGKPEYITIEGPEKDLLEVLSLSISGLPSEFDSDRVLPETTITGEIPPNEEDPWVPAITEHELQDYNLPIVFLDETTGITSDVSAVKVDNTSVNTDCSTSVAGTSGINIKKSWKSWSPRDLKTKKNPLLTPKKKVGTQNTVKMDSVLTLREELLKNQLIHCKNEETRAKAKHDQEEARAQAKHEKEMRLLDLDIIIKEQELNKKL